MKRINKLKSNIISRQVTIAKLAVKLGTAIYRARKKKDDFSIKEILESQVTTLVEELGIMKGSIMKAGQMLSLYGAPILSNNAQKILRILEDQSQYVSWDQMRHLIPTEWHSKMKTEEIPIAAASIGQVHKVHIEGKTYAMKIQYPGVRKAVKSDVRNLKLFLKAARILPSELDLDAVGKEIQTMLEQETNYKLEVKNTEFFKERLESYSSYIVPAVCKEFSNDSIITTEFLEGFSIKHLDSIDISQQERNKIGEDFLRLLFIELFEIEKVQSDVHLGNYLIIRSESGFKIGLLDFGATKSPSKSFIRDYRKMIMSIAKCDREEFFKTMRKLNYLSKTSETNEEFLWEYAMILGEPFQNEIYDFGSSDISQRIFQEIPKFFKEISIGNPPTDAIFLDRKVGGVFFVLQKLGAKINPKAILQEFKQKL